MEYPISLKVLYSVYIFVLFYLLFFIIIIIYYICNSKQRIKMCNQLIKPAYDHMHLQYICVCTIFIFLSFYILYFFSNFLYFSV